MKTQCYCCGAPLGKAVDVPYPRCTLCARGCARIAKATILRGPACPFLEGRRPPTLEDIKVRRGLLPPRAPAPQPTIRTGAFATDDSPETFEWRGRRRRNIPGG